MKVVSVNVLLMLCLVSLISAGDTKEIPEKINSEYSALKEYSADFDGDGLLDKLIIFGKNDEIISYLAIYSGATSQNISTIPINYRFNNIDLKDLNQDERADIIIHEGEDDIFWVYTLPKKSKYKRVIIPKKTRRRYKKEERIYFHVKSRGEVAIYSTAGKKRFSRKIPQGTSAIKLKFSPGDWIVELAMKDYKRYERISIVE